MPHFPGRPVSAATFIFILCVSLLGLACDGSTEDGPDAPGSNLYVSIGDSVAAGNGASDAERTSFPALMADERDVELSNFAKAGATTQVVLDTQLPDVLPLLRTGVVRFVTLSAGGNDLAGLIPNAACVEEPLPASCPLDETLDGVSRRLDEILMQLRAADADVPIVLLGYPNFFDGTGHPFDAPAGRVLPLLTETMQSVAMKYERIVMATPSFAEQSSTMPLTHVLDERFDPHPNDAGHRIIADAMLDALEEVR